jgi:hypothetical protein
VAKGSICRVIPAGNKKKQLLADALDILNEPGIYVLYRDGIPYYIGKVTKLRRRLGQHAWYAKARYYHLWNFFSFFVVNDSERRDEIERVLIAAMPTTNSAQPKLPREKLDKNIATMLREIRQFHANPPQ